MIRVAPLLFAALFFVAADGQTLVYVSNSGSKYHRENCSALRRSKIEISLSEAIHSGYGPCQMCSPPVLDNTPSEKNAPEEILRSHDRGLYRVNTAGLTNTRAADTSQMIQAEVIDHVDGDTVRVRISNPPDELRAVETIRMLGVDTPETVHPQKPVEDFGKAASDYTKERLLGRSVLLAFDWDLRDRYGRLLAYIYNEEGCFNAELIRRGYSFAYTRYTFQFAQEFRALEQNARREKWGLWAD